MEPNVKVPTLDEIKSFLDGYGWKYRETTSDDNKVFIISPYTLEQKNKGILISFKTEGEFVMVSTVDLLKNVPNNFAKKLLDLNDQVKLVKLYSVISNENETFDAELGFELWSESWNKETFYSFMDMLSLGIEKALETVTLDNIPHQSTFINFS